MLTFRVFVFVVATIGSLAFSQTAHAESAIDHCVEQKQLVAVETAQSIGELTKLRANWSAQELTDFFFAYRSFELQASSENAAALLKLTPQTEQQEEARYAISGHDCSSVTDKEYKPLDSMYDGLSPLLAKAIMLAPQLMDRYVSYSLLATEDVHSDYADQMVPVCRAFHPQFLKAVSLLSEKDRKWMRKHLFDPEHCKSLNPQEE